VGRGVPHCSMGERQGAQHASIQLSNHKVPNSGKMRLLQDRALLSVWLSASLGQFYPQGVGVRLGVADQTPPGSHSGLSPREGPESSAPDSRTV
jgi:hypothetical protein